jgi:hypothetical protein
LSIASLPLPSKRAKVLKLIGKIFGYDYVLGVLLDTEKVFPVLLLQPEESQKQQVPCQIRLM